MLPAVVFFVSEINKLEDTLEVHPYANIKNNKIYRKAFLDYPEKEIGEVRDSPADSIKYFEDRFETAKEKVAELEKQIENNQNKGSFLMKLIHMRDYLAGFSGIGDFAGLFEKLARQEGILNGIIHQNRVKNTEIKTALLGELEILKDHFNIYEAGDRIREIKNTWIRTGAVTDEKKELLESGFTAYLDHFNKRRDEFFADKRKMTGETIEKYREIIRKAGELKNHPDVKQAAGALKGLQHAWKELVRIPPEEYRPLNNEFRKINDLIFNRLKEELKKNRKTRQEADRQTLTLRKKILGDLRGTLCNCSPGKLSALKEEYLEKWKKTGNSFTGDLRRLNMEFRYEIIRINEIMFLDRLAEQRERNCDQLNEEERDRIKARLLKNLIDRDKREIARYTENMESFNLKTGSIDRIVNSKLQEKKISLEIKKGLYDSLVSKKSGS